MKLRMNALTIPLLSSALILCCLGCGSGGGGHDIPDELAKLDLKVDPQVIDSGDATRLVVDISNLQESVWTLKIRFPAGLAYIENSSFYVVGDNTIAVSPKHYVSTETDSFLVFYPTQNIFEPYGSGVLMLRLEGVRNVPDGLIAVDADIYDPDCDAADPQFDSQDDEHIRVGPAPPKPPSSGSAATSSASSKSSSSSPSSSSSTSVSSSASSSSSKSRS